MRLPKSFSVLSLLSVLSVLSCHERPRPPREFDGQRAFQYIQQQVAFGPRVPGTRAHESMAVWLDSLLRQRADSLIVQSWNHQTGNHKSLPLKNFIARYKPAATQRLLLLAHWDSRPVSDSPLSKDSSHAVMGANDGGSGVALLLGVADVLKRAPPAIGVDLLFVDGEDYGNFSTDTDVLMGSKYFADHLPDPDYRPLFGVLWDMIGDAQLNILQEGYSVQAAPEVVARVWSTAEDLGYSKYFIPRGEGAITDDHVPLIKKGLRVIDVIDIDYVEQNGPKNYHHTIYDTIDKVSAKSLQVVGDVAVTLVSR
jgi:glutaminyl-peptide cyclotransferase